ncbi:MAG: DUF1285 domain-containing protein [Sphingomonadales bacterium]
MRHIGDQSYPPVEQWEPDFCGAIDIRIDREGRWYYQGSPIGRERLVKLFASVLRRDRADGPYFLVTPVEKLEIQVDVAPLLAVEMTVSGEGVDQVIAFRTNVDDYVIVDDAHPLWLEEDAETGEPVPLLRVRGRIDALLSRPVFYQLIELARPRQPGGPLGVWSSGGFFELGGGGDED